ncbi:PA14 domain-containing protein [Luteolibacter algae]|uniref:PA14 domain-containing protein n=1 Tax=Luteolibacter algae TaxID=454151 RepID=A0ABW5D6S3_9BACT
MSRIRLTSLFLTSLVFSPLLHAQDGGQLYTLYCSACHAPDGKGATGGVFPPLAGSPWVAGDARRSISVVLKGLHGPVEVNGKGYNLEMPPQESVLADDVVAAILTYVRSSWGNKAGPVTTDEVKAVRAALSERTEAWTAPELLKLYPLPVKETALKNLTSRVYKGQWVDLPNFDKIQPEGVEEEHNGIIDLGITNLKNNFGIVWEGDFIAKKKGPHRFFLDADDGARILIDGEVVAAVKGMGPVGKRAQKKKVVLDAGTHSIRIEYFDAGGNKALAVGWEHLTEKKFNWLSVERSEVKPDWPEIMLTPKEDQTVIYRNFIDGTSARAIGFGFPGGINIAYSADHLAPELIWKGKFISAGRHWTARGQGNEPPAEKLVNRLTKERYLPSEARFKGYTLDKNGNPTFNVDLDGATLSDTWKPGETGTIIRTLELKGGTSDLVIPLGNPSLTGMENVTVTPGKTVSVTYTLK